MTWPVHTDVLNPQTMLDRLDALQNNRRKHLIGKRLSDDDIATIRRALTEGLQVPHAAFSDSPARRPPPIVYLPADKRTSAFQSLINQCIDPRPPVDRIGHFSLAHWLHLVKLLYGRFAPCDPRWVEAALARILNRSDHPFVPPPDTATPVGDVARVVLVGDWATGLPQAINVATQIRIQLAASGAADRHVIHLGDTYYSGQPEEYVHRFLANWPVDIGANVKSWSLNGNHDMYSGGYGYFGTLLTDDRFRDQKGSSNFVLRNRFWQVIGIDSAHSEPYNGAMAPEQIGWLRRTVDEGEELGCQTILLSHHQPFTAYEEGVSGSLAANVAAGLGERRLAVWIWGHEHRCTVYRHDVVAPNYDALARYTATLGHGGVPMLVRTQAGPVAEADEAMMAPDAGGWEWDATYTIDDDTWALGGFAVLSFDDASLSIEYCDEDGVTRRRTSVVPPSRGQIG